MAPGSGDHTDARALRDCGGRPRAPVAVTPSCCLCCFSTFYLRSWSQPAPNPGRARTPTTLTTSGAGPRTPRGDPGDYPDWPKPKVPGRRLRFLGYFQNTSELPLRATELEPEPSGSSGSGLAAPKPGGGGLELELPELPSNGTWADNARSLLSQWPAPAAASLRPGCRGAHLLTAGGPPHRVALLSHAGMVCRSAHATHTKLQGWHCWRLPAVPTAREVLAWGLQLCT